MEKYKNFIYIDLKRNPTQKKKNGNEMKEM